MGKILPILLALIGLGGGVGAGLMLRPEPAPEVVINPCGEDGMPVAQVAATPEPAEEGEEDVPTSEFVKMNNQFVVPVVAGGDVSALVVMAISIEVQPGKTETVYQRQPKVRDALLQTLFDHANAGGFDGAFTVGPNMQTLRVSLVEAARVILGPSVIDILITDIARQDIQ